MTVLLRTPTAEGYDRLGFTISDVERMVEYGILPDDNSYELWEGEIVPKVTKNDPHEVWKRLLAKWFYRTLPDHLAVAIEPTLRLGTTTFVEPDLLVHPATLLPSKVRGPDVLLAVEVADSSLARDLGRKRALYAKFGVDHYWVVDAVRGRVLVHSVRENDGYALREEKQASDLLILPFEPRPSFRLADLG